jgi:hypothetical protein
MTRRQGKPVVSAITSPGYSTVADTYRCSVGANRLVQGAARGSAIGPPRTRDYRMDEIRSEIKSLQARACQCRRTRLRNADRLERTLESSDMGEAKGRFRRSPEGHSDSHRAAATSSVLITPRRRDLTSLRKDESRISVENSIAVHPRGSARRLPRRALLPGRGIPPAGEAGNRRGAGRASNCSSARERAAEGMRRIRGPGEKGGARERASPDPSA